MGNPFRVPTRGFHHSYFVHMLYLAYITIILLARSKSAAAKMFEIKYIKNTRPCKTLTAVDPAKRGLKRARTEREMLDFRPGGKRAHQLTRGLIGLIATSLLGTRGTRCSPWAAPHSPHNWGVHR